MASFIKIPPELKSVLMQFIGEADETTLAPLADKLGISPSALFGIIKIIPVLTDDNFDLQSILPKILPVALNYFLSGGENQKSISSTPAETLTDKKDAYAVYKTNKSDEWDALIQSELY